PEFGDLSPGPESGGLSPGARGGSEGRKASHCSLPAHRPAVTSTRDPRTTPRRRAPARKPRMDDIAPLVERRRRLMGRQLHLFYDPPLHLVRGEGVWLHDATGRRYLDVYNNVPHVGHCHPRVVAAIAAQAGRLNTNTRYLGTEALDYAEALCE